MGHGTYAVYNVEYAVFYEPFWEASSGSYSSDDFAGFKLYWIDSMNDIKCDLLGNFVEPPAEDRCLEGVLREGKKAVHWTRSECRYPVTVTATNWSYYYPYQAQSSKSKRTEAYQKGGTQLVRTGTNLGGYPSNGVYMQSGTKNWSVLESVTQKNLVYIKNDAGIWTAIEQVNMYVCTGAGWVPIERVEVMRSGGYDANGPCNFWTW